MSNKQTWLPHNTVTGWYFVLDYTSYGPFKDEEAAQAAYDTALDKWIQQRSCGTGNCEG